MDYNPHQTSQPLLIPSHMVHTDTPTPHCSMNASCTLPLDFAHALFSIENTLPSFPDRLLFIPQSPAQMPPLWTIFLCASLVPLCYHLLRTPATHVCDCHPQAIGSSWKVGSLHCLFLNLHCPAWCHITVNRCL